MEEAERKGENRIINVLEDTKGFVPPRSWTAWPLRSQDVPREGDEEKEDEADNQDYVYKRRSSNSGGAGEVMEEVLIAEALKVAKIRFRQRVAEMGVNGDLEEFKELGEADEEIAFTQDGSEASRDPSPAASVHLGDRENASASPPVVKNKSKKISKLNAEMMPVVSTDDDRSRELLRPSIRHTLSKLDDMLLALHHARSTCLEVARLHGESEDDEQFGKGEEESSAKRPVGRPRKYAASARDLGSLKHAIPAAPEPLLTSKKPGRGRPKKEYPRLEGETDEDFLIRVAKMRKKPLPVFTQASSQRSKNGTSSRLRSPTMRKKPEEALVESRNKKLGVRDWSEVLASAALVGFDPNVLKRTAQRCADMFGESLTLNTIVEAPFGEDSDILATYKPEAIPNFDPNLPLRYEDSSSDEADTKRQASSQPPPTRPPKIDSLVCSEPNCARQGAPFRDLYVLVRHLKEVHNIDTDESFNANSTSNKYQVKGGGRDHTCQLIDCPREGAPFRDFYSLKRHLWQAHQIMWEERNDEKQRVHDSAAEEDPLRSDEEMDGGVHVDGFLKLVPAEALRGGRPRVTTRRMARKSQAGEVDNGEGEDCTDQEGHNSDSASSQDEGIK